MKKINFPIIILAVIFSLFLMGGSSQNCNLRRPFCGFSANGGYYYQEREQAYVTREAKAGDASGILEVVDEVKKTIGINVPISVFIAKNENNCYATIGTGGRRMIIADQLFLNHVNKLSGTQWAAISIIAHEIGHHIAGFSRRPSQLDSELDADYWSGYALQKLGASKEASIKCIMKYGTELDTDSHPNKYSRATIIKQGWEDALSGKYDTDRCESCN